MCLQLRDVGTRRERLQKERQGQGERRRRRQEICQRKKENDERQGRKVLSNLEDPREDVRESRLVRDTKDIAGRAATSDTSHQNVDGESLTSTRKMQTAENTEDNLNQRKTEKSEECGSSEMWRISRTKTGSASITHSVEWKQARAAQGADPSSEYTFIVTKKKNKTPAAVPMQVEVDAINHV